MQFGKSFQKWIVLGAGFLAYTLIAGLPYSLAVVYAEWRDEFEKSNSETALIQSLCIGTFFVMGFLSGSLTSKFGSRKCGIISGIVIASSVGLLFVVPSFTFLILSIGICLGGGNSVNYVCATTAVSSSFEGRGKITALAVLTFGSGIGTSVCPLFVNYLITIYGWRGCFLIISSILLHLVLFSLLYGDIKPRSKQQPVKQINSTERGEIKSGSVSVIEQIDDLNTMQQYDADNRQKNNDSSILVSKKISVVSTFKEVLCNKIFIIYAVAYSFAFSSYSSSTIFIIDYFESKGFSRNDAVSILLFMNIANAVSRLLIGIVKQVCHINVLAIPVVCTLVGGICTSSYTLIGNSFALNTILGCLYFATQGCMITQISTSTSRLVSTEQFAVGMGILMSVTGITNAASGPAIGYIRDVTGDYEIPLYVISGILCLSSFVFFMLMFFRQRNERLSNSDNTFTLNFDNTPSHLVEKKNTKVTKF